MDIRPFRPDLLDDWIAFFDGPAFADNPDWRGCWCRAYRFRGDMEAWDAACASGENRGAMIEAVRAGTVQGCLAYDGGRAVGWVQFGPRERFKGPYLGDPVPGLGAIVCFVVAATHRRRGVARALSRGACAAMARAGLTVVEACPLRDEAAGPACEQFHGPRALYLSEGFSVHRDWKQFTVVRKLLAAP